MSTGTDLSKTTLPPTLVIGAGYVGTRLWQRWPAAPWALCTSSAASAARLQHKLGAEARVFAWNLDGAEASAPVLPAVDAAVYLAPPPTTPADGTADPRVSRALQVLLGAGVRRVVYVSTTAVYGDAAGGSVDENSALTPGTARGARRLDAERRVQRECAAAGREWCVLRVPGIYGPGRLPLERLQRGDPVLSRAEARPGNRIHVDDLVDCVVLAMTHERAANAVFNVGDGDTRSMTDYLLAVAEAAGLPQPPEVTLAEARRVLSPQMMSYLEATRRVETRRVREWLGFKPRFARLETGIAASLQP